MDIKELQIKLEKARTLTDNKTTASGIKESFDKNVLPMFYHTYNPEKSFLAVPPELLMELAEKAGEDRLVTVIGENVAFANTQKQAVIKGLQMQAKAKFGTKKKS